MECNKIQETLSSYLDGILTSEENKLIDEHLKSCQKCQGALADLKKTVEHIKNIEEAEPPAWFTQKTMARIKAETGHQKGFLQKLFYPLHIKLPIEAIAVIAIAVTTIYIFKSVQSEIQLAKVPSEEISKSEAPSPVIARDEVSSTKGGSTISGKQSTETALKKDGFALSFAPAPPLKKAGEKEKIAAIEEAKPSPAKPTEIPMTDKEPVTTGKFVEAQKAPAPAVKMYEAMPSAGVTASINNEMKRESLPKLKAFTSKVDKSFTLTIITKDIDIAAKNVDVIITQLKGKIIKAESLENKKILIAEIGSNKLQELIEKLRIIGRIKEKEPVLETGECREELDCDIVRVTIILSL